MKKSVMALGLSLLIAAGTAAAQDRIKVVYEGETVQMDVDPIIQDGRTLVPLRAVLEKMGAEVTYDNGTQKITVTRGEMQAVLYPGNTTMTVLRKNEAGVFEAAEEVTLDVPPAIVGDRTLLPIRYVVYAINDALDKIISGEPDEMVTWDPQTQTVIIQDGYAEPEELPQLMHRGMVEMVDDCPQMEISDDFGNTFKIFMYTSIMSPTNTQPVYDEEDLYFLRSIISQTSGAEPQKWGTSDWRSRYDKFLDGKKILLDSMGHHINSREMLVQEYGDGKRVAIGILDVLKVTEVTDETISVKYPDKPKGFSQELFTNGNEIGLKTGDILKMPVLISQLDGQQKRDIIDTVAMPYPVLENVEIKDDRIELTTRHTTCYTKPKSGIGLTDEKNILNCNRKIIIENPEDCFTIRLINKQDGHLEASVMIFYAKNAQAYATNSNIRLVTSNAKALGEIKGKEVLNMEEQEEKQLSNVFIRQKIEKSMNRDEDLNYAKVLYYDGMDTQTE